MAQLDESLKNDTIDNIVSNDEYIRGLNANMCDSFLDLIPKEISNNDEKLELYLEFSPLLPLLNHDLPKRHVLRTAFKGILIESGRQLRRTITQYQGVFIGKIIVLHAKEIYSEDNTRSATIQILDDNVNSNISTCEILLDVSQYLDACTAHMKNQTVKFAADIERIGSKWKAETATDFSILLNEQ